MADSKRAALLNGTFSPEIAGRMLQEYLGEEGWAVQVFPGFPVQLAEDSEFRYRVNASSGYKVLALALQGRVPADLLNHYREQGITVVTLIRRQRGSTLCFQPAVANRI